MKTIRMLATEHVASAGGPLKFFEGKEYTVDDWVAATLMGRGFAVEVETANPLPADSELDLENRNIAELRELAKARGVPGWKKLKKPELISALIPLKPPSESFEVLDNMKGKEVPVFVREE